MTSLSTRKTVAKHVIQTRTVWGMNQAEFGAPIGKDHAVICRIESADCCPSKSTLILLAAYLGCSVRALATGQGWSIPSAPADLKCFNLKRKVKNACTNPASRSRS